MVDEQAIAELAAQIAAEYDPDRIILFGSYAYGTATMDSDVDLLVIMPFEGSAARKAAEIRNRVGASFALDLILRTPEEVERRLAWNDFFLREATQKGRQLYATAHP